MRTASRDIVLIDAPGHAEFLRNMITGASQADGASDVIAHIGVAPRDTRRIRALIFWLHDQPLTAGQSILLGLGTRESRATVVAIEKAAKVDIADMVATDRFGLDLRELTPINRWRPIFKPTTCAPGGWCWKSTAGSPATGWCSAFEAASLAPTPRRSGSVAHGGDPPHVGSVLEPWRTPAARLAYTPTMLDLVSFRASTPARRRD